MKKFQLHFITNKTLVRWLIILKEFEKKAQCNSNALSAVTNSTRRTVGSDIRGIREFFKDSIILKTTPRGYAFHICNDRAYLELKTSLLSNEPLFVLLEKLFYNKVYSLDEWADYFHLSNHTLQKYLTIIEGQLTRFNLTLTFNPIAIIGNEIDIRTFFCAFFYESDITPHTIFPTAAIQQAVNEMGQLLGRKDMASFALSSYLLFITVERFNSGRPVLLSKDTHRLVKNSQSFQHFLQINEIVSHYFDCELSKDELLHLYLCMLTKRKIASPQEEQTFCQTYNHWSEVATLSKDFYTFLALKFRFEQRAIDLLFIESYFITAKLKESLSSSMHRNIEDINLFVQETFPKEYQSYLAFLRSHPAYNELYSVGNLADFTVNLVMHMETIRECCWGTQKRIAFLFEGNHSICRFVEAWSQKYFGQFHHLFYPDAGEVNRAYLVENRIDFLVTNYAEYVSEFREITDCLLFRTIPSAGDWNQLFDRINPKITYQYHLSDRSSKESGG